MRPDPVMGGVYAHRSMELTLLDIPHEATMKFPFRHQREDVDSIWWAAMAFGNATVEVDTYLGVVVGAIKLWGEVVEHERGYRASFAKVVSIDYAWGVCDLDKLRIKYALA